MYSFFFPPACICMQNKLYLLLQKKIHKTLHCNLLNIKRNYIAVTTVRNKVYCSFEVCGKELITDCHLIWLHIVFFILNKSNFNTKWLCCLAVFVDVI